MRTPYSAAKLHLLCLRHLRNINLFFAFFRNINPNPAIPVRNRNNRFMFLRSPLYAFPYPMLFSQNPLIYGLMQPREYDPSTLVLSSIFPSDSEYKTPLFPRIPLISPDPLMFPRVRNITPFQILCVLFSWLCRFIFPVPGT